METAQAEETINRAADEARRNEARNAEKSPNQLSEAFDGITGRIDAYRGRDRDPHQAVDAAKYWREAGIPERHKGKVADRHSAEGPWGDAYKSLSGVLSTGPLIILIGGRGTGKTQMACGLLADIANHPSPVRYMKAIDLFREIRDCYRKDGPSEISIVKKLTDLGGLVIDESHERSDSAWENMTLTNIIDRRYDSMRTTILVSNLGREAFAAAVGPSIVSRIHEVGRVIECNWPSFRDRHTK
jgi:hypothetical protein